MFKQDTIRQLIRFAVVGGVVAGVQFSLIWFFYSVAGLGPRASFWAAYFPATALHFSLTKWWTFRSRHFDLIQLGRYLLSAAVAGAVQFGAFHFALVFVTSRPTYAYPFAAGVAMFCSFLLLKRKVFRDEQTEAS